MQSLALHERGEWNHRERRTPEEADAEREQYFQSSDAYDPETGVFSADWAMGMACARLYRRSNREGGAPVQQSAGVHCLAPSMLKAMAPPAVRKHAE